MTWTYAFTALLIAHIAADFAVRREFIRRENKAPSQPVWVHMAVFAAVCLALLSSFGGSALIIVALAVGFHWLADYGFRGTALWRGEVGPKQRWFFIVQQATKIAFLALIAQLIAGGYYDPSYGQHSPGAMIPLGYAFGYVFALFVGDAFVSFVLTNLKWPPVAEQANSDTKAQGPEGAGRIIGIFEALLVTTFVIGYQYGAVGLVLAAKSVARFEWLKNNQGRGEYFLIGTLSRLTCALAGGLLALYLAGRPMFPQ